MASTKDRKPAQIVKCPSCNWMGSARGLFSHHRLSHKDNNLISTKAKLIKQHPHAIKINNKSSNVIKGVDIKPDITQSLISILSPIIVKIIDDFISGLNSNKPPKREAYKVYKNGKEIHRVDINKGVLRTI
jgi:hypothetical protein